MPGRADRRDAGWWALAAAALLALAPIGWISPDGFAQAQLAQAGTWRLNPSHLLFEPANAAWVAASQPLLPRSLPADRLRRLSALGAALALGLFRLGVAPRLARTRAAANYATAWFGGSAVFLLLAVSAETYMLQLPAVVLAAAMLLRLGCQPSAPTAAALGAAIGVSTLFFVSNVLLVPAAAAAIWFMSRQPRLVAASAPSLRRQLGWLLAGFSAVVLPCALVAWCAAAPGADFLDWLSSYGGGQGLGRLRGVYGVQLTPVGIAVAALRAGYGAAKTVVDLVPAVAQWRDEGLRIAPLLRCAVAAIALWSLAGGGWRGRSESRQALLALLLLTVPPTLLFGWLWNNSDEQFYAPLALGCGALAAGHGLRTRRALAGGVLALAWNAGDVATRYALYPRQARVAELERLTAGAALVLYPGFDELGVLLALADPPPPALALTALVGQPPEQGLSGLRVRALETAASGGRVVALGLYDRPPSAPPWKFLRALGYPPAAVREALSPLGFEPAAVDNRWGARVAGGPKEAISRRPGGAHPPTPRPGSEKPGR